MKISFSNSDMLGYFTNFIKRLDLSKPDELIIQINSRWTNIHPACLVFAAALALKVGKDNAKIIGDIPTSVGYLDRMGLYDFLSTDTPFSNNAREEAGRFVPITVIRNAADQSKFISNMIPLLHLPEDKSDIIKYIIGELVRNVLEHAQALNGAVVAAQYYRKSNRIGIGICDTGIGIWKSMNSVWHPKTDLDAIELALTPGITGTTNKEGGTSDNAGAGLFYIKSMAKMSRSYFVIYSGRGEYTLLKHDKRTKHPRLYADPDRDRHSSIDEAPDFRGTLVGVDIALDNNPEFDLLLSSIGRVYDDAIRERKRLKYREPRFI